MAMIQYPNETASFAQGVDTGQKLGSMWGKKENVLNIPLNDPGPPPKVDLNSEFGNEKKDLDVLNDYHKNVKELNPDEARTIYDTMKTDILKTDFGKAAADMVANGKIKPDDINNTFNKIKSGTATKLDIELLKSKFVKAGVSPTIVDNKIEELKSKQKQLTDDWALKARNALLDLDTAEEKIKEYGNKGRISDSLVQFMQNVPNYIPALANTSPEDKKWVEDYLKNRTAKGVARSSGGKPTVDFRVDENGKLGVYSNGQLDKNQSDEQFTTTGAVPISKEDMMLMFMKGTMPTKGNVRGVPESNPKSGAKKEKIANDDLQKQTYEKYLKQFKDNPDKEREAIKKTREDLQRQGYTNI
jgi:hypothetical protein